MMHIATTADKSVKVKLIQVSKSKGRRTFSNDVYKSPGGMNSWGLKKKWLKSRLISSNCLRVIFVLSLCCLHLFLELSSSWHCVVFVLYLCCLCIVCVFSSSCLCIVFVLSSCYLGLVFVLSLYCLCVVFGFSLYCLCVIFVFSSCCLCIV